MTRRIASRSRDRNQMVLLSLRSSESQAQVTPSALRVASHCAARVDFPKPAGAWISERRRGRPALRISTSRARRTQFPTGFGGWNFVVTLVGAYGNDSPPLLALLRRGPRVAVVFRSILTPHPSNVGAVVGCRHSPAPLPGGKWSFPCTITTHSSRRGSIVSSLSGCARHSTGRPRRF